MSVIDEKIKECEDISNDLWREGRDEYEYIGIGGSLNKNDATQFVRELEDLLNKWDWQIFHFTGRIEEHRSR